MDKKKRKLQLTYDECLAEIHARVAKTNQNQVALKYGLTKQNLNLLLSEKIMLSEVLALKLGYRQHIYFTRCRPVALKLKRGRQPRAKVTA
jgi:hypothetical protein